MNTTPWKQLLACAPCLSSTTSLGRCRHYVELRLHSFELTVHIPSSLHWCGFIGDILWGKIAFCSGHRRLRSCSSYPANGFLVVYSV